MSRADLMAYLIRMDFEVEADCEIAPNVDRVEIKAGAQSVGLNFILKIFSLVLHIQLESVLGLLLS